MSNYPRIAIVYLSFHADAHLPDFALALSRLTYPKEKLLVVIVDNPHPAYGSSKEAIEKIFLPRSGRDIPETVVLAQKENRGFSGGNNVGARFAMARGCEYIFFHNDDGYLASGAMEPLVAAMESDPAIAIAQSLILLHPETQYLNSAGNSFHYLGFGYCNEYRSSVADFLRRHKERRIFDIGYASGAAVLLRADLLRDHGLWEEDFFMYHEDIDMTLRMRSRGWRIVLACDSVFYHKYEFNRSIRKFFWMERNRFAVLIMYYRWRTLLLLLPMLLIVEAGLFSLSVSRGTWRDRLAVYAYWSHPATIRSWLAKRRDVQKRRTRGDHHLLHFTVPSIIFQEASLEHPLVLYGANPVMRAYWLFLKCIVWW